MFNLQLDLVMFFTPPMEQHGKGIRLTRTLQLPFAPFNDLCITGFTIDTHPMPEGFCLKSVVWDVDRSRFTAETFFIQDLPIALIADEIQSWIDIGWDLGSHTDDFPDVYDDSDSLDQEEAAEDEASKADESVDDMDDWQKLSPRNRPKEFNKSFRALIRVMCETHNDTEKAYAMWKTKRFFSDEEVKSDTSPAARQFADATREYLQMPFDAQWDWRERVCRTYPRFERVMSKPKRRHQIVCKSS